MRRIVIAMPRRARIAAGGYPYHVLNRAAGLQHIFRADTDFLAFERTLLEAHARFPIPILAWCILSNHWHFVTFPEDDGLLTQFFRWLTLTHAMRWRVSHRTVGLGPLYQGRFKSFIVEDDDLHLLTILRYTERQALSAGLVKRAEQWRWSSLWTRLHGSPQMKSILAPWPVDRPRNWTSQVNAAVTQRELERIELSMKRQRPYGDDAWIDRTARRFDLQYTLRNEGRPRKLKSWRDTKPL